MRRRLLAVSLTLAVPIGALCAPLVHVHPDDHHDDHHASGRVHAHLSGHNLDDHGRDHHDDDHDLDHHHAGDHGTPSHPVAVEAEADPEQASRVTFFVAVQVDDLIPAGLQPLGFTLPAPLESVMRRPPVVSHGHDPPAVSSSSPRAPPSRLS